MFMRSWSTGSVLHYSIFGPKRTALHLRKQKILIASLAQRISFVFGGVGRGGVSRTLRKL